MYDSCGKGLGGLSAASEGAGEALGSGNGRKDRKLGAGGAARRLREEDGFQAARGSQALAGVGPSSSLVAGQPAWQGFSGRGEGQPGWWENGM